MKPRGNKTKKLGHAQSKRSRIVAGLTRRAWNVLRGNGLAIEDLKGMTEEDLLSYRNCGVKTAHELLAVARQLPHDAPSSRVTSQHWLDLDVRGTLSVRARNILKKSGLMEYQIATMTAEEFLQLKNCGVKTADELERYAKWLSARRREAGHHVTAQLATHSVRVRRATDSESPILLRKTRAYLTNKGFSPDAPGEWDLNIPMDELGARNLLLGELADIKARWFLSRLTGLKVDNENVWTKRFPPERLIELYCTHRDIPFVARLCGLEISEARKRLKRLRSCLQKLDGIRSGDLQSEMKVLLPAERRDRDIVISRNVPWGLTLEALAKRHGITRERVRQVEGRERRLFLERYECARRKLKALPLLVNAISDAGQQLSHKRLREMIDAAGTSADPSGGDHVDAATAVIQLLAGVADEAGAGGRSFADSVRNVSQLPQTPWLSIAERSQIDEVPLRTRRDIKRRAFNAGAVDVTQLERNLGLRRAVVRLLLWELGLEPVDDRWYVPTLKGNLRRVPLLTATSKLLQASGPTHIEDVQLALSRHAQRLKFVTVGPQVLEKILSHYGCVIEGGTVREVPSQYVESIGGVERVFVEFVRRHAPVVSFWELYEEVVLRSGYSLPSLANALCRFSAIVAPVDVSRRVSLYTIRGYEPSETDIRAAMDRQRHVSGRIDYERTLEGVKVSFAAGSWLLTSGVQVLPDVDIPEGDWSVRAEEGERVVAATVSNLYMYGLPHVVAALALRKGEPTELEFNLLKREAVLRRKRGEVHEK